MFNACGLTSELLLRVRKPGRYTGGEYNQVKKEWAGDMVTFALAFPDIYEIGMSHLGSRIIYHILNGLPYVACERVFAPWVDMEDILRSKNIPLFSLENQKPIKDFDILGFSLGYELNYTNVLNMLDLSGIEIYSNRRKDGPIVIAGGIGTFSPEPMAPFIDAFVIGDGEEAVVDIAHAFRCFKSGNITERKEKLIALDKIEGIYVPELYNSKSRIKKRIVKDLDKSYYPTEMIVPYLGIVHDRYVLEIMRGCTRGCRFCQAGFLYRPLRERSIEKLVDMAKEGIKKTGFEELSLVSLSSGDYSGLKRLLESLDLSMTSISLSSLHVDNITPDIVSHYRGAGFTFAPETADLTLCASINKKLDYDKFLMVVNNIFEMGYQNIKFYFMIGLPGENESSAKDIYGLVSKIMNRKPNLTGVNITISVSNFIPKAHTPFQWEKMESLDSLRNKQIELKKMFKKMKRVKFNYHDLSSSFLEAVLSRGDQNLSSVIFEAWRGGARFDSWRECFNYCIWEDAFEKSGIDPYLYSHRERDADEVFPWDFIETGVNKEFLKSERDKARNGIETPDCRNQCVNCGVCGKFKVKNILTRSATSPDACHLSVNTEDTNVLTSKKQ